MPTVDSTINVSDLRTTYRQVFEAVSRMGKRYEVLCNGQVVGFIVGPAGWQMMNETLEILTDPDLLRQIFASEKDIDAGVSRPAEDVFDAIERELDSQDG